jgi:hypothetical protein
LKYDDHYIELLETITYNDKKELNIREGYHIVQNIENIVNKNIAGRTRQEYKKRPEYIQYQKEYMQEYNKRKKALRNGTTSNTPDPEPQDDIIE